MRGGIEMVFVFFPLQEIELNQFVQVIAQQLLGNGDTVFLANKSLQLFRRRLSLLGDKKMEKGVQDQQHRGP